MKTKLFIGLLASSLLAVAAIEGCGGDTGTGTGGTTSSTGSDVTSSTAASGTGGGASTTATSGGTGGSAMPPAPPKLGTQIDRFGRPAINTALNHTFDVDPAKGMAKDKYNQQSDPATWGTSGPEFAKNLAILDGLDTNCGNQLLATVVPMGMPIPATRYATLAGALADDRVYLDLSAAACTTYLAVEANATGLLPNMDCGGRKLDYDVIDASYSALAAGAFSGVGDGVSADADTKGSAFPYLAVPH
ncbi:MAG: DUF4331 family protein [Byssovorax sp.]